MAIISGCSALDAYVQLIILHCAEPRLTHPAYEKCDGQSGTRWSSPDEKVIEIPEGTLEARYGTHVDDHSEGQNDRCRSATFA